MDLDLDDSTIAFRDSVREFLAENIPSEPLASMDTAEGFEQHRQWENTLADARLSVVSWPSALGGRDASLLEWVIFEEEYYAAAAPGRVAQNGIFLLAPTLFEYGTEEQRERFLPRMGRGDDIWAQAWSEPEAGSDLAGIRSSAKQVEGGWVLNGQKTWSSRASFADWGFGLFRSDPEAQRHRGLTYVMFPLTAEGVTVRPIPQLDGEAGFAEIFFEDVFVPDADVIGQPNDGWRVAMSTSSNERGLSLRSPGRFTAAADRLIEHWKQNSDAVANSNTTDRVVDAWIGARAYRLHTFGTVTRLQEGGALGAESSVNKIFWSELDVALHETALDLLGDDGELDGSWQDGYLFSLSGPIYAGTNEIQRNIVAERLLGLPKADR
ncbi:acyl-CoA dehydrogenase [Rhodococcus sp. 1163]|uniref:acyl-CoA dehydrogenase family protein n=1 Tax=unclassified Rhodococcus (in: high G+C Gram-positive bacteria) TaxID=192944 RepID=UPI000A04CCBE|nr:acyl-CoA dehydrogenase family protein [Rhodococcus sp. 1163]ORI18698.1 acyl-CoA dehydrogenase [Rhodococcus sp. 1163]